MMTIQIQRLFPLIREQNKLALKRKFTHYNNTEAWGHHDVIKHDSASTSQESFSLIAVMSN